MNSANTQPNGLIITGQENKQTRDLYLAAALHAEGVKFIRIDKTEPKRMIFVFAGGDLSDKVEREWYQQTAVGSYSVYAASLKMMKSLIHSL